VIKGNILAYMKNYIVLDDFKDVQQQCSLQYLTVTFSTGSLFDIENDFKSSVYLDFGLPFYEDSEDINSDEFIQNRSDAKERLISLLDITPAINITPDDIVLYPTS